jgi:hypothetical protein
MKTRLRCSFFLFSHIYIDILAPQLSILRPVVSDIRREMSLLYADGDCRSEVVPCLNRATEG